MKSLLPNCDYGRISKQTETFFSEKKHGILPYNSLFHLLNLHPKLLNQSEYEALIVCKPHNKLVHNQSPRKKERKYTAFKLCKEQLEHINKQTSHCLRKRSLDCKQRPQIKDIQKKSPPKREKVLHKCSFITNMEIGMK